MTPKNNEERPEDEALGVLDDAASLDTTGIGILGGTAQVSVTLPTLPQDEDDDLADEGVVEGEVLADLIIDDTVDDTAVGRIHAAEIVIELPAEVAEPVKAGVVAEDTAPKDAAPTPPREAKASDAEKPARSSSKDAETITAAPSARTAEDGSLSTPASKPAGRTAKRGPLADAPEKPAVVDPAPKPVAASDRLAASAAGDGIRRPEPTSAAARAEEDEEAAEAARFLARANADREAAGRSGSTTPARIQKETAAMTGSNDDRAARPASARAEVTLTSKRLDDLGDASRESADLLTADRLLDPARQTKPEPEGAWSHFLYTISGHRINLGDGRRARDRKALTAKIAAPLSGGARFVPVLSRKGGVGKTAITALLGMALADAREDRVIAVDANPDRGTLADRIVRAHHGRSVRDLVRIHDEVKGYHDISAIVTRDTTRLDVLASDADPRIAEAFSDSDYRDVADVAAHYYSLVLTDTGTGIVHSVMSATLDLADQIVIVSGLSVDEARLASETLTWLETNGYAAQAREAIVVLNQSTPGAPLVRLNELEAHFATRASHVVRVPYDPQIAGGGAIVFSALRPETRQAARELAALLVDGLRAKAA